MTQSAADIKAGLKKYHVKDLRMIFHMVVNSITTNTDFIAVKAVLDEKSPDSLIDVVNDNLADEHIQVDFQVKDILSGPSVDLLNTLDDIDSEGDLIGHNSRIDKMKKDEIASIMSSVLADPALLEGLCCTYSGSDENLGILMRGMCCEENYRQLCEDPVFRKRRAYYMRLRSYILAAVNLYGAISVVPLAQLIWNYEKDWHRREDYVREGGPYSHTLAFCPRYFTEMTLHDVCGNTVRDVCMNIEGLIVNECFRDEFLEEQQQMFRMAAEFAQKHHAAPGHPAQLSEEFFEAYQDQASASYRDLLKTAAAKPRYAPGREEFLRYADPDYIEQRPADIDFQAYLRRKYRKELQKYASDNGISLDEAVQYVWEEVKFVADDHSENWSGISPVDTIQIILDDMKPFGITFAGISDANEFLAVLMPVINGTRLWSNNGHTPDELMNLDRQSGPFRPTVVPMSSGAAKLLGEGKDTLEKMGVRVDLDATASEATSFTYPQGLGGPAIQKKKKIYPNDPCPCGSGRKYKYCCGRKK